MTKQCSGLPPASALNHRPDGPKADHALTIKLDHFNLLYDEGSRLCKRLGLLQREAPHELLPVRVTFLVDENRKVIGKWDEFDVKTHSDDVVSFIMDIMDKT